MDRYEYRCGLGHDRHRLIAHRPLIIGGILIPFDRGLSGHSDADVLLHALTDALLGAAGLGDIGEWFSNDDPRWKNCDSAVFIKATLEALAERTWEIVNVDVTIHAERPVLSPHKSKIRHHLSDLLAIDVERINIKAKSGEAAGPVGRGEVIDADAIVLLRRPVSSPNK